MSLPALLSELAALLPERVIWFEEKQVLRISLDGMNYPGGPCCDAWLEHRHHLGMIEMALRDECETRGWEWMVQHQQGQHEAVVFLPSVETGIGRPITPEFIGKASTPAEAMTHAVLKALKSEKGSVNE